MDIRTGTAPSGDLHIHYEDMGDRNDPAVLLIMGLGAQLILWRTGFCERLVNQGLRVIRFDNRDVGLSSKLPHHHAGAPLVPRMARSLMGLRSPAAYTLVSSAQAQPPGPGLPRHAPSVKTWRAPGGTGIGGFGTDRTLAQARSWLASGA